MTYNSYSDGNLWDEKRKTEGPWQTKAIYSPLSLNRHLYKMDTSVKGTLRVGPCLSVLLLFDFLSDGHLSKTDT